jgi:hypothetical protein
MIPKKNHLRISSIFLCTRKVRIQNFSTSPQAEPQDDSRLHRWITIIAPNTIRDTKSIAGLAWFDVLRALGT